MPAGIHLIIAAQRPSTDVITGVIKNNLPTRMSFRVASRHDSATVINSPGAENLLGMGDMLYLSNASPSTTRIHGAFVTEEEVQRVADFWKAQGKPNYDAEILKPRNDEESTAEEDEDLDGIFVEGAFCLLLLEGDLFYLHAGYKALYGYFHVREFTLQLTFLE